MKRGVSFVGVFMIIILGLAVIWVIWSAFGDPLRTYINKQFGEKGVFQIQKPGEEAPVIAGTSKKVSEVPLVTLAPDHDKAFQELISQMLICWSSMSAGSIQNYRYTRLQLPDISPPISKEELRKELEKSDKSAADSLVSNWDEPIKKSDPLLQGIYLICCDHDTTNADDLFLTNWVTFECE